QRPGAAVHLLAQTRVGITQPLLTDDQRLTIGEARYSAVERVANGHTQERRVARPAHIAHALRALLSGLSGRIDLRLCHRVALRAPRYNWRQVWSHPAASTRQVAWPAPIQATLVIVSYRQPQSLSTPVALHARRNGRGGAGIVLYAVRPPAVAA